MASGEAVKEELKKTKEILEDIVDIPKEHDEPMPDKDSSSSPDWVFYQFDNNYRVADKLTVTVKVDKKEEIEWDESVDLDLFGGCTLSEESERYDPVVPYDAVEESFSYLDQPDVSRLPQTHVIDVIRRRHSQQYREFGSAFTSLSACVRSVEGNVAALAGNKGRAYASGVFIAPNLFLTARHVVENKLVGEFTVKLAYQKQELELFQGDSNRVAKIVEESDDLDYAILLLEKPIENFKPIPLELRDQVGGNTIFIHHPKGGPKVVSVHASIESQYEQLFYSGFHDTAKGSSGGPYFTSSQKIFGLHLLNRNGETGVRWIKDIYQKSPILRRLYNTQGVYNRGIVLSTTMPQVALPLAPGRFSQEHIQWLERVDKPLDFEKEFASVSPLPMRHSRHHIIPTGDMALLWFMGEENINIKRLLLDISYDTSGAIESVEWATWNLFTGPDNRPKDPINGDPGEGLEPRRPLSYPEPLWDQVQILHTQIQACWQARMQLSIAISSQQAGMTATAFRSREVDAIEVDRGNNLLQGTQLKKTSETKPIFEPKRQYLSTQKALFDSLVKIKKIIKQNRISAPHPYTRDDWQQNPDGQYIVRTAQAKFKIKGESTIAELARVLSVLGSVDVYRAMEGRPPRELSPSNEDPTVEDPTVNEGSAILPRLQNAVGGRFLEEQYYEAFIPGKPKFEEFLMEHGFRATQVSGGRLNCYIYSLLQHVTGQYNKRVFDASLIDTIKQRAGVNLRPEMIDPSTEDAVNIIKAINGLYGVNLIVRTFQINRDGKPGITDTIFDAENLGEQQQPVFLWLQPGYFVAITTITLYNSTLEDKQHQEQESQEPDFWELDDRYADLNRWGVFNKQLAIQKQMQRGWESLSELQQLSREGRRYWATLKLQQEHLCTKFAALAPGERDSAQEGLFPQLNEKQKQINADIEAKKALGLFLRQALVTTLHASPTASTSTSSSISSTVPIFSTTPATATTETQEVLEDSSMPPLNVHARAENVTRDFVEMFRVAEDPSIPSQSSLTFSHQSAGTSSPLTPQVPERKRDDQSAGNDSELRTTLPSSSQSSNSALVDKLKTVSVTKNTLNDIHSAIDNSYDTLVELETNVQALAYIVWEMIKKEKRITKDELGDFDEGKCRDEIKIVISTIINNIDVEDRHAKRVSFHLQKNWGLLVGASIRYAESLRPSAQLSPR